MFCCAIYIYIPEITKQLATEYNLSQILGSFESFHRQQRFNLWASTLIKCVSPVVEWEINVYFGMEADVAWIDYLNVSSGYYSVQLFECLDQSFH